ncbi:hypothetical protein L1887_04106 [Cichorium endivia]|nr:hypothetical protein L1887_04106 [Cichorium endivia]
MAILSETKPGDDRGCLRMDSYCGDIIESNEQEPDTCNLGISYTKLISGICSSDRGRHVIKNDRQIWSQMKDELRNLSELSCRVHSRVEIRSMRVSTNERTRFVPMSEVIGIEMRISFPLEHQHGPCSMNTGRAVHTEANRRNIVDLHGPC